MKETIGDPEIALAARWLADKDVRETPGQALDWERQRLFLRTMADLTGVRSRLIPGAIPGTPCIARRSNDGSWEVVVKPGRCMGYHDGEKVWHAEVEIYEIVGTDPRPRILPLPG